MMQTQDLGGMGFNSFIGANGSSTTTGKNV